ncbi:MAG TPA: hypothetical protein VIL30_09595 [Ramlibacter sp.]|jgi:hypothetical protein
MRAASHFLAHLVLAGGMALAAAPAAAQIVPDYALTAPVLPLEGETAARIPVLTLGPMQLGAVASANGSGLSLQAGEQWFGRLGVGRSFASDAISLGGGYRFADGQAVSMHVTRQLGQERLGLAVRYDFNRAWLRLGYEAPTRNLGGTDLLRFSAGVRF